MQNVLENTADAVEVPQKHPRLVPWIFRDYRNNLGLFWQVMFPLIIVNLLFYAGIFLFAKAMSSEGNWTISTESYFMAYTSSSQSGLPIGVTSGTHFDPAPPMSLLWLAICPLVLIIVQRRNSIDSTFKTVWRQTLRKTVPILGIAFFIGLLAPSVPGLLGFLVFETFFEKLIPSHTSTLFSVYAWITFVWFFFIGYCVVKWSLYNQAIMIENLSAIGALRRSSELVCGRTWWKFCGIYLLMSYGATVLTSLLLSLTMVFLSFAVPEFIPMREALLSGKLISLLFFGYVRITLENGLNFWIIGTMVGIQTLVSAALIPIWASLTTHLYRARVDEQAEQVSA